MSGPESPAALPVLDRRRFMMLGLGAAGAGLVVSCSAAGKTGGGKRTAEFHGWWPYAAPPTGHFNSFAGGIHSGTYFQDMAEMAFALHKWGSEYVPMLATSWRMRPPNAFEVALREGVTWSDGKKFSAQDVLTTFALLRVQSAMVWNYLEKVEANGSTLVFTMKKPSTVVPHMVLRTAIRAHSVYGTLGDRAQRLFDEGKSATSTEGAQLTKDLTEFRPKEVVVTGPYKIDPSSITSSQLSMVKVPTSWAAKQAHFDRIVIYNQTGAGSIEVIFLDKKIDAGSSGFAPATEKAMVGAGFDIVRAPLYTGPAWCFNYGRLKAVADPRVRQALARALDRSTNGKVALGRSGVPAATMCGMSDKLVERWLSPEDAEGLDGYAHDPARAAEDLKKLGFTKRAGVWVSPQGERLAHELTLPAEYPDWNASARDLVDQMNDFGVRLTIRTVPAANWSGMQQKGKYDTGLVAWGSGDPHPYFSYYTSLVSDNHGSGAGPGIDYDLKQNVPGLGQVDLAKLLDQSAVGLDEDAQKPTVAKLAQAFNQQLPVIPLWERYANDPVLRDVRVTNFPKADDPLFDNYVGSGSWIALLILNGTLKPVRSPATTGGDGRK